MAWSKISLEDLRNRTIGDLVNRLGLQSPVLRNSVVYAIGTVYAGMTYTQHLFLDWVRDQFFAFTCDDSELDRIGAEIGLFRKAPRFAKSNCAFNGPNGTLIPSGSRFKSASTGYTYYVTEDYTIQAGVYAIAKSDIAGVLYTTDDTDTFTLVNPIPAIDNELSSVTVRSNGADLESSLEFRARIKERKANTPQGGSDSDWKAWGTDIQPATDSWVFPNYPYYNSVTLVVANYNVSPPVIADLTELEQYVDFKRPVTVSANVRSVAAADVIINTDISDDNQELQDAITDSVTELFQLTAPGSTITSDDIKNAMQSVPFIFSNTITEIQLKGVVVSSIALGFYEVALLDTINFTKV